MGYDWTPVLGTLATPSGGQRSHIDSVPNFAYLTSKASYNSTTEIEANYITADHWMKESIIEFDVRINEGWRYIGKNLTRRNSPTNDQSEMSVLLQATDGTRYIIFYSTVGPAEGSSTDILTSKDMWFVVLPPRMPDARIAYYLAFP